MVLLSFDIEEFDLPMEYGEHIEWDRQIVLSEKGLLRILDILEDEDVGATFYATATFMEHISIETRKRLCSGKHEIASHGYCHSKHEDVDYLRSRQRLEELCAKPVRGYRMARMQSINHELLKEAGYLYDSSLHPTFLPGRYNHLDKPRLPYRETNGLLTLPASVVPGIRFPLFWLSMHHLPLSLYLRLMSYTAKHDAYLNVYYHPWEFIELNTLGLRLPRLVTRNSGTEMCHRLRTLIRYLKSEGLSFATTSEYIRMQHL